LRGSAEDKEIQVKDIDSLFKRIERIGSITFTGGEPTLATDKIIDVLWLAKKYEIEVGSFYIATNAVDVPDSFLLACIKWFIYCDDNEITQVHWSNDDYHPVSTEGVKKLSALGFASPKYTSEYRMRQENVINEGFGAQFGNNRFPSTSICIEDDEIEGEVYLNVNGDIVDGCDWSYDSQEDHIVCEGSKLCLTAIRKYLANKE
jgi:hypothetical protein